MSIIPAIFGWPPDIEKVVKDGNLNWNHFQHIWIAQFCCIEEGCRQGYTLTVVDELDFDWSKITMDHAEGSDC